MATDIPVTKSVTYSNGSSSTVTYTWKVTGLRTKKEGEFSDSVIHTHWTLTGTDGGMTGVFAGATPFSITDAPEGYNFVPFSQLTEETVLGWIQDQVVGSYANHIMEQIFQKLDGQTNTIVDQPLPWVPQDPV
jgi:hypothetical protein